MRTPDKETRLNVFRKKRGVSVYVLAQTLGVSPQTVSRYCSAANDANHRRPNREAAARLRVWSGGAVDSANYADPYLPEMDAAWRAAGLLPAEPAPEAEVAP